MASSSEDEKVKGAEGENKESKPDKPELSEEEQRFLDKLLAEMDTVASFKNNPGQPQGDLKLLDGDALEQLESHLSIDDQYACPEHESRMYLG